LIAGQEDKHALCRKQHGESASEAGEIGQRQRSTIRKVPWYIRAVQATWFVQCCYSTTRDLDFHLQRSNMEPSEMGVGPSSSAARKVLKKIDRVIIPLLFVTYMLNFMDKTILSSAAVFGLRDDNVSNTSLLR
jgi:hypothetical protein